MKSFKKLLTLLFVLMLAFALTACGDEDDSDSGKKGSSRKKDDDTEQTTPTVEPTDTVDPTVTPDPDVTNAPTEAPTPTPTEEVKPTPSGFTGSLSYDFLKGTWAGEKKSDLVTFMKEYGFWDQMGGEDATTAAVLNSMFDGMKKAGITPNIKISLTMDFTSETDCTLKYVVDASEFGEGLKKYFSSEDAVLSLFADIYGMDTATIKTMLAASGMSMDDLMSQFSEEFAEMSDDMSESGEEELTYKLDGNKIVFEDAEGDFIYDESKGGIVIVLTEEDKKTADFAFLDQFVLKKK